MHDHPSDHPRPTIMDRQRCGHVWTWLKAPTIYTCAYVGTTVHTSGSPEPLMNVKLCCFRLACATSIHVYIRIHKYMATRPRASRHHLIGLIRAGGAASQVVAEKRLLLVLQDLFAAGHDKIRVSSAATYLPQTSDGGKEHMIFREARTSRGVECSSAHVACMRCSDKRQMCDPY